jgi:hypothetical protein
VFLLEEYELCLICVPSYASPHFHNTKSLKLSVQSHEIGIGANNDLSEKVTIFFLAVSLLMHNFRIRYQLLLASVYFEFYVCRGNSANRKSANSWAHSTIANP